MVNKKNILFLSNGRAEDIIAAHLCSCILKLNPGINLCAFPLVDTGEAYDELGISKIGMAKEMPSGGFLFETKDAFVEDLLRGGLMSLLILQVRTLLKVRDKFEVIVCVGDIFSVVLSCILLRKRCIFVQTAKTFRKSSFLPLEISFLKRCCEAIYVRDRETEQYFKPFNLPVYYCGNPMMDLVSEQSDEIYNFQGNPQIVALLPGSRAEAIRNFSKVLDVVSNLPFNSDVLFMAALSPNLPMADFQNCALKRGCKVLEFKEDEVNMGVLSLIALPSGHRLLLTKNHFVKVIRSCEYVIGLAGMANEVACGMGSPVFTFEGCGPQTTRRRFLKQEKLLLGGAKFLEGQPYQIAQAIQQITSNQEAMLRMSRQGKESMGEAGASEEIAKAILEIATQRSNKRAILYESE